MAQIQSLADTFDVFNKIRIESPAVEKIWQEGLGDEYPKEARPDAFYSQSVLNDIIKSVNSLCPSNHNTLLDVGCGHGLTALYLARQLRCSKVFGIDISPTSIEIAQRNLEEQAGTSEGALKGKFWVADATSTGLEDGSCQTVVCLDVMHYFPDKLAAIKEVARILQPGGVFAFTTWEQKGFSDRLQTEQISDHRPLLEEARLTVESYDEVPNGTVLQRRVFDAIINGETALKSEAGEQYASMLVGMAKSAKAESSERRYVLGIAQKPIGQ